MAYTEYITKAGDRMDLIAWRFYGDPLQYEPILDANREVLWVYEAGESVDWVFGDPAPDKVWFGGVMVALPVGLVLYIPDPAVVPQLTILPPWMS